jgi:hypothetical protein
MDDQAVRRQQQHPRRRRADQPVQPVERLGVLEERPELGVLRAPLAGAGQVDPQDVVPLDAQPGLVSSYEPGSQQPPVQFGILRRPRQQVQVIALRWRGADHQHRILHDGVDHPRDRGGP